MTKPLREIALELLKSTACPRDKLPYTDEFDRLHKRARDAGGQCTKFELMQLFFAIAKRGGFAGRKSELSAPEMDLPQTVFIGRWLGDRLAARDSLTYSQEFKSKYLNYLHVFGYQINKNEFWLSIDGVAKKTKGSDWRSKLLKAQESALIAVEIYNKPLVNSRQRIL